MAGKDLLFFLRSLQEQCEGKIPFERFMQEALYHPDFGYYSVNIRNVGSRGDFSTSATLDGNLGRAISRWIRTRVSQLKWRHIPVIEIGAGNGVLAHSILRNLGWLKRRRTHYQIVETSPVLRNLQRSLLGTSVSWASSVSDALQKNKGIALIISNELVDAFPCRLFGKIDSGWEELGVHLLEDGSLVETSMGELPKELDPWFETLGELLPGQRVERFDSHRKWLEEWAPYWRQGAMLTIDYGDLGKYLYKQRPLGSLRAYWKHRRLTGMEIYARFGKQDLTADVNFSDLIAHGESFGWKHLPLITQGNFLDQWDTASTVSSPTTVHLEVGEAFKVLEQTLNAP